MNCNTPSIMYKVSMKYSREQSENTLKYKMNVVMFETKVNSSIQIEISLKTSDIVNMQYYIVHTKQKPVVVLIYSTYKSKSETQTQHIICTHPSFFFIPSPIKII